MHMRDSFSMRGGSIVGAVLLVALISAAAVAIDSGKGARDAMLAQVTMPTSTAPPLPEKKTANTTEIGQACEMGFDYAVRMDPEAARDATNQSNSDQANLDSVPVVIQYALNGSNRTQAVPTKNRSQADRCAGVNAGGAARDGSGRPCNPGAWKCRVALCNATRDGKRVIQKDAGGSVLETCVFVPKKEIGVGTSLDASELKKEAYQKIGEGLDLSSLSSTERQQMEAVLSGGNSPEGYGVLQAYNEKQAEVVQKDVDAAQKELDLRKAALNNLCGGVIEAVDVNVLKRNNCNEMRSMVSDSEARLAAEKAKKEKFAAEAQRLGGMKKELSVDVKPGAIVNCPGGPGCPGGQWNPTTGRMENPDGTQVPGMYCVVSCYPLRVTPGPYNASCLNHPSYPNPQAGCMNPGPGSSTFGGGGQQVVVSPGYGGAYPSGPGGNQPCGAQQQQGGGLLGVVMSLFTKSNTSGSQNCQNGVPVPSCTITASPRNVATGQPVTLTWQSQQAFSANLSSNGSVGPQGSMTVNPQTTTSYTLFLEGYMDNRTGQQLRGLCATQVTVGGQGGGDGAPKAEISCRPEMADVGMSVALSFACKNSATSGGSGFSTNGQLSGSATPVVESPSIGSNTVKYGLTCSKEGKTDTAECTVEINKTSIVLIANPKAVASGGEANIGWITSGMESCTISSPTLPGFTAENSGNTSTSGVAKTPNLTSDAEFLLSCTTKAGGTKTAETKVTVN